jgi:8-oxo-dGTP pyrophosphatase MutT (NUDIX family)
MDYTGRAQCLVIRDNKILMVKHKHSENEWNYCLPGGRIEKGETPEQAAIRELQEECLVCCKIIKKVSEYVDSFDYNIYTFHADIGEQNPALGGDPEFSGNNQILNEVRWLSLNEICERDRAFLWAAGLFSIVQFADELLSWSDDISYPNKRIVSGP